SARQGPHHSAQKSTNTGVLAFSTLSSKLPSVNVATFAEAIPFLSSLTRSNYPTTQRPIHPATHPPIDPSAQLSAPAERGRVAGPSIHFDILPGRRVPRVILPHPLAHQPRPDVPLPE